MKNPSKALLRIICISICILPMALNASQIVKKIPDKFQGSWASNVNYCGMDHLYNLEISNASLSYWESSGPTVAIIINKSSQFAAIVEMSGEGDEWLSFIHFSLSKDGRELKDISNANTSQQLVRYKCDS